MRQGSADAACKIGKQGGADAVSRQKDHLSVTVFMCDDYNSRPRSLYRYDDFYEGFDMLMCQNRSKNPQIHNSLIKVLIWIAFVLDINHCGGWHY